MPNKINPFSPIGVMSLSSFPLQQSKLNGADNVVVFEWVINRK